MSFEIEIALDVDSSSDRAKPEINAPYPVFKETLEDLLSEAIGAYGHVLPSYCTGFELAVALVSPDFAEYSPKVVEGDDFIQSPPPVPEGAMS